MKIKKIKCSKCLNLISAQNYKRHFYSCGNKKVLIKIDEKWQKNNDFECPHCFKIFSKYGISTHILRKHSNIIINWGHAKKGKIPWNKNGKSWNSGKTKKTDQRIKKLGEKLKLIAKKKKEQGIFKKSGWAVWNEDKKRKQSIKMTLNNPGGKSKWYEINGKKVQGTWELNIAKKLNDLNIKWERCNPIIYKKEEKEKRYTPDFYLPEYDKFLEIKGFWWGDDKEKMKLVLGQNCWLKNKILIIEKDLYNEVIKDKNLKIILER